MCVDLLSTYDFLCGCIIYLQIPVTTTRILLNHFKWDKEKLMERFYDGDQEKLFSEAHVVSPFKATNKPQKASVLVLRNVFVFLCK